MPLLLFALSVTTTAIVPVMGTPFALGSAFMISLIFTTAFMISVLPTWFGATLFLVYIGAVMVLFLYMCCLSPNQRIQGPRSAFIGVVCGTSLMMTSIVALSFSGLTLSQTSLDGGTASWMLAQAQAPIDLASRSSGDLLIFSGLILFFTLISVVKICKKDQGPLRPFKRSQATTQNKTL
uniref:NADH dehydrogenase subunit 6 n=1 Tax=Scurria scurra TaxID=351200 RepID=UPI001EE12BC2|nr:NADH dehydrogenase subunit 6 [Scurria scurra]UHY95071.1 NADH dehydrogenase subunit 6 [Scurria scurra]